MKPADATTLPLDGVQLIEASAGTGKTHTITTLFLRLLLERGLAVDQILVVTFTNAATAELKDRIRARLREAADVLAGLVQPTVEMQRLMTRWPAERPLAAEGRASEASEGRGGTERPLGEAEGRARSATERLNAALRDIDRAKVSTIHGFCQRVLEEHAFESGVRFGLELMSDARPLFAELARDFFANKLYEASPAYADFLKVRGIGPLHLSRLARRVTSFPDVEPPRPPRTDHCERTVEHYFLACRDLAAVWPAARQTARAALLGSRSPRSRTADNFESRLAAVDAVVGEDASWLDWSDDVDTVAGAIAKSAAPRELIELFRKLCAARRDAARALDDWLFAVEVEFITHVRSELERRKERLGVQSFDDLLQQLRAALRAPGGAELAARVRALLPAALIDEFHDTDPVQYEIFRTLYSGSPRTSLFLIGDPKQAIYSFRGADLFSYLEAARDAEGRWTLSTSYRADPGLVEALNVLFSRVKHPFVLPGVGFHPVAARAEGRDSFTFGKTRRAPLEVLFVPSPRPGGGRALGPRSRDLPELVAREISYLLSEEADARLDGRPIQAGDIAVLTRTNLEARQVQDALRELRIPAVLHGDLSVFETEEADELGLVLAAIAEPSRAAAVRTALSTSLLGLDANELFELGDDETWERWSSAFHRWHDLWQSQGLVQAFRRMLCDMHASRRLLGRVDGERKLTNFFHLTELLGRAASEERLGISGLLGWYEEACRNALAKDGQMAADTQQIRLESDAASVQLTTMHRSKGLEYGVVFCPYLWKGLPHRAQDFLYHDPDDAFRLKLGLRAGDHGFDLAQREAFAESVRLAYVALTRAKHRTVVFWGRFKGLEHSALGYVLHQAASGDVGATAARIARLDDRGIEAELAELVASSGGTIEVTSPQTEPRSPRQTERVSPARFTYRKPARQVVPAFRLSSFSAMAHGAAASSAAEGRDADELVEREEAQPDLTMPRGPKAGELIHQIFERVDFQADDAAIASTVSERVVRLGFDAEWMAPITGLVRRSLERRLSPRDFRLRDIARSRRLCELEFTFSVADAGRTPAVAVTPAELASVFRQAELPGAVPAGYSGRIAALGFAPLRGHLRGFIDLVFEHDGRFFVVDYKSNYLGPHPSDYTPERLAACMAEHHYYLQYYLYTVALHRYLARRVVGYDYERHFGGVYYLFVRALSPEHAEPFGIFYDEPQREVIETLSDKLARGVAA